jgi:hypothetical protein
VLRERQDSLMRFLTGIGASQGWLPPPVRQAGKCLLKREKAVDRTHGNLLHMVNS